MNSLDNIAVVLYRPEDPINIGAVVRAMKNMGLSRLRLVEPVPFTRQEILRIAHHSEDLLDRIETFPDLNTALEDTSYVVGTVSEPHPGYRMTDDVRTLAADLVKRAFVQRVAMLFGPEADGLDRFAMDRCHLLATLPADATYPSLNLAQSVLLFLYELRTCALNAQRVDSVASSEMPAKQGDLERMFRIGEEALTAIEFFKYNPDAVMHTLRQITYRAELTPQEVALLMAIARQLHARWRRPLIYRLRGLFVCLGLGIEVQIGFGASFPGIVLGHGSAYHLRDVMPPVEVGADGPADRIVDCIGADLIEFEAGTLTGGFIILSDRIIQAAGRPHNRQSAVLERIDLV